MKTKLGESYQLVLIGLGIVATAFMGIFFLRELFPEYKIYQDDFTSLEAFRATYTGEPAPPFKYGVKQIVTEREDKGPAKVERCISCHVALQIPDYSATKLALDKEGQVIFDKKGYPKEIPNENYIWKKLDDQIAVYRKEGNDSAANKLAELKTAEVGEAVYDISKVLRAHPLIGKETRPFEYHPLQEYGCVSCHNGNGQGLSTDKAHGPVFDHTYEAEYMGFKPEFLEKDEKNDPAFSRVFNEKPGHKLLFQTSPLYVGALMQAKCVDCHLTTTDKNRLVSQLGGEINETDFKKDSKLEFDELVKNYERGGELFVSQACYACHRISGYARGGVGPELTKEGNSYPWFVKESIVWPQADLKTSTMPNYRLDHNEVEDLLTFLLAQKGERKALSGTLYRNEIAKWDKGEQMAWEKPSTAAEIHDLDYGMTVFATEGCAACHRLKGFDSQVGYAAEKNKASYDQIIKEQAWFTNLFGEHIFGSEIYAKVVSHAAEIDRHLAANVHKEGLLDKLEVSNPGLISAYYPGFKYAERKDQDPAYQARLHNVLMMFVKEYGLGRQVGPKPNWSGVYRTNKWLIEHFKNPQAEIPRSIMPVMPFDETKFYALTYMLEVLGKKNRDELKKLWEVKGFDPEQAYKILCAQCHGDYLEGNGPVAEWIYPIPKNIRKAEFLRNLTKEQLKLSLLHGVKGTPMPPWGEVGQDKFNQDAVPVLNADEIEKLADWLFSFLQGGQVIRDSQDVPKWHYSPKDVLDELQQEGDELPKKMGAYLGFPEGKNLVAALAPSQTKDVPSTVNELFETTEGQLNDADQTHVFIRKEFYTPENIALGHALFNENCTSCHGKEADGSGLRAEAMYDAKPRMLTNLHWIESRDDLRLLRSIKFGVAGTSMQPWGDVTTSKQRLLMVIYIRSLSQDAIKRSGLMDSLYQNFDTADRLIEEARFADSKKLSALKEKANNAKTTFEKVEDFETFKAEKAAGEAVEKQEKKVALYAKLRNTLKDSKLSLQSIGTAALAQDVELLGYMENLIKLSGKTLAYQEGKLVYINTPENEAAIAKQGEVIDNYLAGMLKTLRAKEAAAEGNESELNTLQAKQVVLENIRKKTGAALEMNKKNRAQEAALIKEINTAP